MDGNVEEINVVFISTIDTNVLVDIPFCKGNKYI